MVLDGKKDYLADRQEIRPELRNAGLVPNEARMCQVVPTKSRMGEYVPNYDQAVAATTAGREAAQALMKLLTCEFDGLVINSKRVSDVFEEKVLKETGLEIGSTLIRLWFLKEVVGMENAEMTWTFFNPAIKALPVGQVEVMLMAMYDEAGVLLKDHTRLMAVRFADRTRYMCDLGTQKGMLLVNP